MVCAAEAGGKKKTQNHNPESGLALLLRAAVLECGMNSPFQNMVLEALGWASPCWPSRCCLISTK